MWVGQSLSSVSRNITDESYTLTQTGQQLVGMLDLTPHNNKVHLCRFVDVLLARDLQKGEHSLAYSLNFFLRKFGMGVSTFVLCKNFHSFPGFWDQMQIYLPLSTVLPLQPH